MSLLEESVRYFLPSKNKDSRIAAAVFLYLTRANGIVLIVK
jgi:hypothetical protein